MNRDEVLQEIEEAAKSEAATLDLSNNQLTELPSEIAQLQSLSSLYLRNNQLTELPSEIAQLQSLGWLDLSNNQLTELPSEIAQLQSLSYLDLRNNQLTELPSEIAQLQSLGWLDLSNNQLTELPSEIAQLQSLSYLDLSHNPDFPASNELLELLASSPYALFRIYFNEIEFSASQIRRSIEFPPELKEAGMSVLSYFSRILNRKYPDMDVGVTIEQKDTTVTLIINTPDGQKETIERELADYGLVVTGQKAPEEYLDDTYEIMSLKNKLELAQLEVRQTERLLESERTQHGARINALEEHIAILGSVLDHDRYVTRELMSSLGSLSAEASEANKRSLEAIMSIIERGVTEGDRENLTTELRSIKETNPSLFKRIVEIVAIGGLQGVAGNILFQAIKMVYEIVI